MFHILLYQPEIPPNTGNVIRLCANIGATLHLIEPLGFSLDDRQLRRAGMDYRELAGVRTHRTFDDYVLAAGSDRLFAFSTRGSEHHASANFQAGDALLFGPETRGLPQDLLTGIPAARRLRLPMVPASRSVNLSNAVAVAAYEAWRQIGFAGGE